MEGLVRGIGVVRAVGEEVVSVRMPMDETPECRVSSCDACQLCDREKVRHLDVVIPVVGTLPILQPGDRVVVEYQRRDPGLAALLFFLPPLAGLVFGGHAAVALVGGGDWVFLGGALTGFVVGAVLALCLSRMFAGLARPEARLLRKAKMDEGIPADEENDREARAQ